MYSFCWKLLLKLYSEVALRLNVHFYRNEVMYSKAAHCKHYFTCIGSCLWVQIKLTVVCTALCKLSYLSDCKFYCIRLFIYISIKQSWAKHNELHFVTYMSQWALQQLNMLVTYLLCLFLYIIGRWSIAYHIDLPGSNAILFTHCFILYHVILLRIFFIIK